MLAETPGSNNYINAAVGLEDFDNDRQLSSRTLISLGFEHRYDRDWAAEVFLADSSPRIKGSNENIDLTQFGLDAIYYFDTYEGSNIQPYGALGIGHSDFDADSGSNEETQARLSIAWVVNWIAIMTVL